MTLMTPYTYNRGVYLCLIFEMSIWEFITNSKKKSISKQTRFFVEFELDFYCLCSLQKSILKSNGFFNFFNLIFRNWKKIEWHSIFQKSSGDRQGEWCQLNWPNRLTFSIDEILSPKLISKFGVNFSWNRKDLDIVIQLKNCFDP